MNLTIKMSSLFDDEGWSDGKVLDLTSLEGTNSYCSDEARAAVEAEYLRACEKASAPFPIRWIDSGDYHYLSAILAASIREPFELVLLDNHPDDQPGAFDEGLLSCGNWVAEVRKNNPFCANAIWLQHPPLPDLQADAHIINPTSTLKNSQQDPLPRNNHLPVYLSIDTDILAPEYASTDWNQGTLGLDELLEWLGGLKGCRILAADVCGGLTINKGAGPEDLARNVYLRKRLKAALEALFA